MILFSKDGIIIVHIVLYHTHSVVTANRSINYEHNSISPRLMSLQTQGSTGNPLAIVQIQSHLTLEQTRKQALASEFNLSETVFLRHGNDESSKKVEIDIFTTGAEVPFAGHPTIGTSYLLSLRRS